MGEYLLIGGGGHCRSVLGSMLNAGMAVRGVLDASLKKGGQILGVPVLGTDAEMPSLSSHELDFIVTLGGATPNQKRSELFSLAMESGLNPGVYIAPSAVICPEVSVGRGSVVLERAVLNTACRVGENCIINTGAILEHDAAVGNNVTVSPGAVLNGGCSVGDGSFIGAGAIILQGVKIGRNATIGAGAVVLNDIPDGQSAAGVPAMRIRA